jgi:archaellum component FlaC
MAETAETDEVDYYEEGQGDEDYEEGEGGEEGEDEPEDMNKRVLEMEDELNKLTEMQQQVERQIHSASDSLDENSVYVVSLSILLMICDIYESFPVIINDIWLPL